MEQWMPIEEVAKELDVPSSTLRRYLSNYKDFVSIKRNGSMQMVSCDSLEVLRKIRNLHVEKNMSVKDVTEILHRENPMMVVLGHDSTGLPVSAGEFLAEILRTNKRLLMENREIKKELYELRELMESNHLNETKLLNENQAKMSDLHKDIRDLSRRHKHRSLIRRISDAIRNKD